MNGLKIKASPTLNSKALKINFKIINFKIINFIKLDFFNIGGLVGQLTITRLEPA